MWIFLNDNSLKLFLLNPDSIHTYEQFSGLVVMNTKP